MIAQIGLEKTFNGLNIFFFFIVKSLFVMSYWLRKREKHPFPAIEA